MSLLKNITNNGTGTGTGQTIPRKRARARAHTRSFARGAQHTRFSHSPTHMKTNNEIIIKVTIVIIMRSDRSPSLCILLLLFISFRLFLLVPLLFIFFSSHYIFHSLYICCCCCCCCRCIFLSIPSSSLSISGLFLLSVFQNKFYHTTVVSQNQAHRQISYETPHTHQ